jgi:dipeptidyl aminopeptidase/acylaminoacyl peptidase
MEQKSLSIYQNSVNTNKFLSLSSRIRRLSNYMTAKHTKHCKKTLDFGNWPSPITAELIAGDSISIDEPKQTQYSIFYIERRPAENGRCVIVQQLDNETRDVLPAPFSARSRAHEYGGGCYYADDDIIFFINDADQDIYSVIKNQITRITSKEDTRFADLCYDKRNQRLISVCETHHDDGVINSIISINITNGEQSTLLAGNDFYASPRLNSSATQLCWQTWNHPNMPWDGNHLWLADIDSNGHLVDKKHIAGDDNISVFQPQWSPDDILYYISDDTSWWHLYRYTNIGGTRQTEQLTFGEKEFGLPQWVFAQSTYAFISNTEIICCYQRQSKNTLAILSLNDEPKLQSLSTEWQEFRSLSAADNKICFIAASSLCFPQLISTEVDIENLSLATTSIIKTTCTMPVSSAYYSQTKVITFTNRHQQTVYANYYPPTNPDYQADRDTLPPLIVISHGGPTGQSSIALDPKKQYWTSRGFAILDVNYSGSTGYGKYYRLRLNGQWGVLDVEDCCDAALHAVEQGSANKNQLIIRGSSAGGFTVLSALTFQQVFSAGASYYGISELTSLASDTHKFESRYLDNLIGPYPETKTLYQQRSPINSADELNCPVIFFQGIDDKVVPKEQAEKMFHLLSEKGLTVAAQYFPGEQHGFRQAKTIIRSLKNELTFYQLVFNLTPQQTISFVGNIQTNNI